MLKRTLLLDIVTCVEVHIVEIFAALLLFRALPNLQIVPLLIFLVVPEVRLHAKLVTLLLLFLLDGRPVEFHRFHDLVL